MDAPVYHLAFIGPDGVERRVYRTNFACRPAGGRLALPLALNDAAGTWTLEVREVATGATRQVSFQAP